MNGKQALALRERAKLRQTEFWNLIGLSQTAGSRYESGKRRIPRNIELLLQLIYGKCEDAVALFVRLRAREDDVQLRQVFLELCRVPSVRTNDAGKERSKISN